MLKTYYMLTKPGIILGNVITTAGGFALASHGFINWILFLETMLGLALVIASAGVFNSYFDRKIDAKMERTKNRPFARNVVNSKIALLFGTILGFLGLGLLFYFTNILTVLVALFGLLVYLVLYGTMKYNSLYGTIIGSIAGAVPPVVGYCAVSNQLDFAALILFMIMVLWQMPHFFAIAVYRINDYAAASIPVLPLTKGIEATKWQSLLYILAFMFTSLMLTFFGYTGIIYAATVIFLSLGWLVLLAKGFKIKNDQVWAKQMFVYSLIVIMGLYVVIPFDLLQTN